MFEVNDLKKSDELIAIRSANNAIVTVRPDGSVEIGEGMTVQGAARETALIFWLSFSAELRQQIKDFNQ